MRGTVLGTEDTGWTGRHTPGPPGKEDQSTGPSDPVLPIAQRMASPSNKPQPPPCQDSQNFFDSRFDL